MINFKRAPINSDKAKAKNVLFYTSARSSFEKKSFKQLNISTIIPPKEKNDKKKKIRNKYSCPNLTNE